MGIGRTEGERGVGQVGLPVGLVTFMFTDIEGSTRLLRSLKDRYNELLDTHNQIIRDAVAAHDGVEVRTIGDSFFCAFVDPSRALAAALQAQLDLSMHPWPAGGELRVRIGLHTGEAGAGGDDYVSLAVHQASRVTDSGHGGQVLVSATTRELLSDSLPENVSLRSLGRYRLKDFPEPVSLYQACHPDLPSEFPALRTMPAAAHNVPAQATLFVGRQTVLAEVAQLVIDSRLVSILGAGGVGKTRVATELVPIVAPHFPDGVWLIELSRLQKGGPVGSEVAAALGVRAEAGHSVEDTLAEALRTRQLLLILDNCEHVLDGAAGLVNRLIGVCPGVHMLATSREALGVAAERRYPLAPLSVPAEGDPADPEASEAVALFVNRSQIVAPGFDFAKEREAVAEICRRLDGLPLAIELAAARTASIAAGRIAARLDRRFSVLTRSYRGSLPHHATLRASIEWSHDFLDEPERVLLRRLGTFTGEFDLEAAEAVCGIAPLHEHDILDLLARLVEKSLVQQSGDRYVMLETIREFAREQLRHSGEDYELANAHLAHYTAVVEEAARETEGPDQRAAYDRLDADLANIRAAVEWAVAESDVAALRLSAALGQYGFIRNRLSEVAQWCIDAVAAAPDAPPSLRARALNQAGFALVLMGSREGGQALVDDGLELARQAGDSRLLAETLVMAADLRLEAGRPSEAEPLAREALELAPGGSLQGRALVIAARAAQESAGYEETHRRLQEALALFERAGDRRQLGRVLLTMAYLSLEVGELEAAEREASRCIQVGEELEHPIGQAIARIVLVWAAIDRGDSDRARALLAETVATARESGYVALLAYSVAARAALCRREGSPERATRLLGALGAAHDALGGEGARAVGRRVQELRSALAQELGSTAFARATAEGAQLTLEEVAAEGL